MDGLQSVRARCAYWEKRIELEKTVARRRELTRFAWAEIIRLATHHGNEATVQPIVSLPKKSPRSRARAAAGGRSRTTD